MFILLVRRTAFAFAAITFSITMACVESAEPSAETSPDRSRKMTGYAPVNGLKMYYQISGEGQPAVYIHPIASHSGLAPALTANRRWIALDLQGHGRTEDIDRPLTCQQHADDIAALLTHLQIDKADFFGDSFGGAIAVTMAVRHPKLVRRIVSYGSPLLPFPADLPAIVTADSDLIQWERQEYQKVAPQPAKWPVVLGKALKCGMEWKGFSPEELKAIKAPVLIACGDHDLIPVERCVELSRQIPNAQLAVIPDASHFVLFSEPERLLPTIAAFLDAPENKAPISTFKTGYRPGMTR